MKSNNMLKLLLMMAIKWFGHIFYFIPFVLFLRSCRSRGCKGRTFVTSIISCQARFQMVTRDALVLLHFPDNRHFFPIFGAKTGCRISEVERVTEFEMLNTRVI
jgi:hypothetical protein